VGVAFLLGKNTHMISGELIKIDGNSVPSIRSYDVSYEKVWKDQTTNMAGDVRSTLLGTRIVLSVEFGGELLQADMVSLLPKLSGAYFPITFYDPQTDSLKTAQYYVDGYAVSLLSKAKGQFSPISVEFKPVSRTV